MSHNVDSWHWEEKDWTPWAEARLKEIMGSKWLVEEGDMKVTFSVKKCDGDAFVMVRKKKVMHTFEFEMKLKFTANVGTSRTNLRIYVLAMMGLYYRKKKKRSVALSEFQQACELLRHTKEFEGAGPVYLATGYLYSLGGGLDAPQKAFRMSLRGLQWALAQIHLPVSDPDSVSELVKESAIIGHYNVAISLKKGSGSKLGVKAGRDKEQDDPYYHISRALSLVDLLQLGDHGIATRVQRAFRSFDARERAKDMRARGESGRPHPASAGPATRATSVPHLPRLSGTTKRGQDGTARGTIPRPPTDAPPHAATAYKPSSAPSGSSFTSSYHLAATTRPPQGHIQMDDTTGFRSVPSGNMTIRPPDENELPASRFERDSYDDGVDIPSPSSFIPRPPSKGAGVGSRGGFDFTAPRPPMPGPPRGRRERPRERPGSRGRRLVASGGEDESYLHVHPPSSHSQRRQTPQTGAIATARQRQMRALAPAPPTSAPIGATKSRRLRGTKATKGERSVGITSLGTESLQLRHFAGSGKSRDDGVAPPPSDTERKTALRLILAAKQAVTEERAATKIEGAVRGFLVRRRIRNEAIRVQTLLVNDIKMVYRGYYQRKGLKRKQDAGTVMQRELRRKLTRNHLRKQVAATLEIQRVWRGRVERQQAVKRDEAASIIQAEIRMWTVRTRYLRCRAAALKIQEHWRAYCIRRDEVAPRKAAIVKMQALVRMFVTKKRVERESAAVTVIAKYHRKRHCRREFLATQKAAVTIQRYWHGFTARAELEGVVWGALTIQKYARMRIQVRHLAAKKKAIVSVNQFFRSLGVQRGQRHEESGAALIQRLYRGYVVRRALSRRRDAAVHLQRYWRGYATRKYLKEVTAATILLQHKRRGHIDRVYVTNLRHSIAVCQAYIRSRQARERVKELRHAQGAISRTIRGRRDQVYAEKYAKAAVLVQSYMRRVIAIKKIAKLRADAVRLQAIWRQYLQHPSRRTKKDILHGTITAQRLVRGYLTRCRVQRLTDATLTISRSYRGYLGRKEAFKMRRGADMIRAAYKGYKLRRSEQQSDAASAICAAAKGHLVRKRAAAAAESATVIQKYYRGFVVRDRLYKENKCAVYLQGYLRGQRERRYVRKYIQAALYVQSLVRRRLAKDHAKDRRDATTCCQRYLRRNIVQKRITSVKYIFERCQATRLANTEREAHWEKYVAARKVQSVWRGVMDRRRASNRKGAADRIRSTAAGYIVRHRLKKMDNGAGLVQGVWQGKREYRNIKEMSAASVKIQALQRGRNQRRTLAHTAASASTIVSAAKAFLAKRQLERMHASATLIQSTYRGHIYRRDAAERASNAIVLTCVARGNIARERCEMEQAACLTIQKVARGYVDRCRVVKMRAAVVLLQAQFRGYLARVHYSRDVKAVVDAQALLRVSVAKRRVSQRLSAVNCVKRYAVGRIQRRKYLATIAAARKCQSLLSLSLCKTRLERERVAAVKAESLARGFLVRRRQRRLQEAAVLVQCRVRQQRAVEETKRWLDTITLLQAMVRGKTAREQVKQSLAAITVIQTQYRAHAARKLAKDRVHAVEVTQSHMRKRIVLNKLKKDTAAALTIQTTFRRVLAIKHVKEVRAARAKVYALVKGWAERRRIQKEKDAMGLILARMRIYRAVSARRETQRAATIIEACYKGHLQRMKYQETVERAHAMQLCMVNRNVNRKGKVPAIAFLRPALKSHLTRIRMKRQARAATQISAIAKGRVVRNNLKFRDKHASVIQAATKAFHDRTRLKVEEKAATTIQRVHRGHIARKSTKDFVKKVLFIQAHFRLYLARKNEVEPVVPSVIIVQSYGRMFLARLEADRRRAAVNVVHTCMLRRIAMRQYQRLRASHSVIARVARKKEVMDRCSREASAALRIQTMWRRAQGSRAAKSYLRSIIAIQSYERRRQAQKRAKDIRTNATIIQSYWKMCLQRRTWLKTRAAIKLIQNEYRVHAASQVNDMRAAATTIQKYWRGAMERDRMAKLKCLSGDFTPSYLGAQWLDDNTLSYKDTHSIYITDLEDDTHARGTFLPVHDVTFTLDEYHSPLTVHDYWASEDMRYLLLACNSKARWRRSYGAVYVLYHIENDYHIVVRPWVTTEATTDPHADTLTSTPEQFTQDLILYAAFQSVVSKDADGIDTLEIALVYSFKHDVYIWYFEREDDAAAHHLREDYVRTVLGPDEALDDLFAVEDISATHSEHLSQLTFDGSDEVYNGVPNWLSEEEVLSSRQALWTSPHPTQPYVAWAQFDDTHVRDQTFAYYMEDIAEDPYNVMETVHYPKAGTVLPHTSIFVSTLSHRNTETEEADETVTELPLPDTPDGEGRLVSMVQWSSMGLLIRTIARNQQSESTFLCYLDEATGEFTCRTVNTRDTADGLGKWIPQERPTMPLSLNVFKEYLYVDSTHQLPDTDMQHLVFVKDSDGSNHKITDSNSWEVTDVLGTAVDDSVIMVTTEDGPMHRRISRVVPRPGYPATPTPVLECGYEGYYSASLSPSRQWMHVKYMGPEMPYEFVCDPLDCRRDTATYTVIHDNQDITDLLSGYATPTMATVYDVTSGSQTTGTDIEVNTNTDECWSTSVKPSESEVTNHGYYLLPPAFSHTKRDTFPLLLQVYGGPNSQKATVQYPKMDWLYFLACEGIVVSTIDGAGTGHRGLAFMSQVYGDAGRREAMDQIAAASYLKADLSLKDTAVVYGWSYGGYAAGMTLAYSEDTTPVGEMLPIQTAISVAPVADWRLYDTYYTERFMGKPVDNQSGYEDSSLLNKSASFEVDGPDSHQRSSYTLIHGTGDDNVHFTNSALLAKRLIDRGYDFDMAYYPNCDHSIKCGKANTHLQKVLANAALKGLIAAEERE
ncbi:hypothetical protein KIPB_001186 [Kipferlia bialata]|uniref:Activator of Hsp90 ATPase AHSA1-like N-terminal domain-containing protein n=1 Tax=Kipferlia bialata TaxID=797122 RepID=A0A9K3CQB5_9EUKA|nr:hypothetical protein KIPB_001186 [Kipferlia bialata]|eukprot:g1186.t1